MAIELQTLVGYLADAGITYAVDEDRSLILAPYELTTVRIILSENGEGVSFWCPSVFNLKTCPRRAAVLQWMNSQVYITKIGHWGYDPRDGEVDVSFFMPVEDGTFTSKQFLRCLQTCIRVVDEGLPQLTALAYGVEVESDDDQSFPGLLEKLRRLGVEAGDLSETSSDAEEPDEAPADDQEEPQNDDDNDDDDEDGDDQGGEAPDDEGESEIGGFAGPWPTTPANESDWLTSVVAVMSQLGSLGTFEARRDERAAAMARLFNLRDESLAAGMVYQTASLAQEHDLSHDDEAALLFMVARQADDDTEIVDAELDNVGAVPRPGEGAALAAKGLVVGANDETSQPWRLADGYLKRLAPSLPFEL